MTRTVVVGAGQGAGQLVASLRQEKYEGEILMIGEEPFLPYQRPPLSKTYLSGELPLERVLVRPAKFYADKEIETRLGVRVTAIDRAARTVALSDGSTLAWDDLVLATGSRVRRLKLPGIDLPGVFYLRTIEDVDAIRDSLGAGKRMVVVGGGYIGLEVAAVARKLGLEVTVLEMEERILQRVTTPAMSAYYTRVHEDHGVVIRTRAGASAILGETQVTGVACNDGSELPADIVIVGVGIIPETELAEAAGLACDNGILVDEHCRTSDPHIYAIGDCTNHPSPLLGRRLRLESVPNAMDQARVTAKNICGGDAVYDAVPWFWSDQYDLKLQMVGFSADADEEVLRGDPEAHQFARFYLKNGVVVAVDAVNSPREFMACKQLVADRTPVDAARLADPAVDLKDLMQAGA
ncbi:MAG: FAD-dependent oxidoreductase [Pseudomonadales bacterium]|jgi:3-phenylpropionate/trans-cinnamate dioxygenase ferredoxin reductase subunit|nr:FAD-dependent oxidoreductase [Pseudomonadales bacterium]